MKPGERYKIYCATQNLDCSGCKYLKENFKKSCMEQFMDEYCIVKEESSAEKKTDAEGTGSENTGNVSAGNVLPGHSE